MATAKKTTKKRPAKRKPTRKASLPLRVRLENLRYNTKFRYSSGIAILLFSIFLSIAFFSFLFTWSDDQNIISYKWTDLLFDSEIVVQNWAGKVGAMVSMWFIYNWFGLSSFGFIPIFGIIGLNLINVWEKPFGKLSGRIIFFIVWLSITLALFFGSTYQFLGGGFGYSISSWFSSVLGNVGAGILLLIALIVYLILTVDDFIFKTTSFVKNVAETKDFGAAFSTAKNATEGDETVTSTKTPEQDKLEPEKGAKKATVAEKLGFNKKNAPVIDGDTNEPLKTAERRNFTLGDDGEELTKDDDLGFEVASGPKEETISVEKIDESKQIISENSEESPFKDTDKPEIKTEQTTTSEGGLALNVQQNKDILAENISTEVLEDYDPKLDLSYYTLPAVQLLEDHKIGDSEVTKAELIENKNKIVNTLKDYKIEIIKIKATIGPTITLYEIIPAPGVRISKIKNLEDDIALSLAALGIRIIAPMPGRGTIGIEVPNRKPEIVSMRSVISSAKFQESKMELPLALGKTISNETYVVDLVKMPHMLVAGATGQGKSVGLNAILASMLYKKHPSQVKFVLVDPKKVELTIYEKLEKHFLASLPDADEAIITDNSQVLRTVSSLNVEMDNRYGMLKKARARNIKEYNAKFIARKLNPDKGHKFLPYIVLVIDEFADLIMTAGKDIELPIARLAQLARAIGIHLIVATQRPSTNIITGVIKANFPARVAFKVASSIDSRTILDGSGANQLIGRGDMLISQGSDMIRLQCAFIDTPELEKIMDHVDEQQGYPVPFFLPEPAIDEDDGAQKQLDFAKRDDLFEEAARMIVVHQQGSTSLIQRKLSIGYNRAGRIVDQLEAAGIIGPFKGSKAREVLYHDELSLNDYLESLNRVK